MSRANLYFMDGTTFIMTFTPETCQNMNVVPEDEIAIWDVGDDTLIACKKNADCNVVLLSGHDLKRIALVHLARYSVRTGQMRMFD